MSARTISIVLGLLLVAAGVLGFVPGQNFAANTPDAMFKVDQLHNIVHLATGALLIVLPFILGGKQTLLLVGVVYAGIAALGFMNDADTLLNGQIAMNGADRYLHVGVTAVLLLAGLVFSNRSAEDI